MLFYLTIFIRFALIKKIMKEKILKILQENSIEIKNLDNILFDLEIFFANCDLTEAQRISALKIMSKISNG